MQSKSTNLTEGIRQSKCSICISRISNNKYELLNLIKNSSQSFKESKIIICCQSTSWKEAIKVVMQKNHISITEIDTFDDIIKEKSKVFIAPLQIKESIEWDNLIFIPDEKLLNRRPRKRKKKYDFKELTDSINKLHINTPVVHLEHGIGIFEGNITRTVKNQKYEMLKIRYEDGFIYVPIEKVNLISPHNTSDINQVYINKLSSESWAKFQKKNKKKIDEIAHSIVSAASKRELLKAPKYLLSERNDLFSKFESTFPYQITSDQSNAIEDVFADLESGKQMDRLICGDVGFGKTEIAIRATFLIVCGKIINALYAQVAFLCPTTFLAKQHYYSLKKRFKGFDIKIELLDGTLSPKKISEIHKKISNNQIDVIVGTSSILSKNIKFFNLGMVICDEEQVFGVKQKEILRQAHLVHYLTLSATPIPRTLYKAMTGVQDLSIIQTPPVGRVTIKTNIIQDNNQEALKNIINLENAQGGQVIIITPRISEIYELSNKVKQIVPLSTMCIMHGDMNNKKLDEARNSIESSNIKVIIATTIIGYGMDFERSNTIIIHKPQMFGIAQIYQIRGRVGRREKQAYCYLLVDPRTFANKEQMKRLEYIRHYSYFGAGMELSYLDLEQRGGGNLLSTEQSGKIEQISTSLYYSLLQDAIEDSSQNTHCAKNKIPEININKPIYLPDDFAPSIELRLQIYRKITNLANLEDLSDFTEEMENKFGKKTNTIQNLEETIKLKELCNRYAITKLNLKTKSVLIWLEEENNLNIHKLLQLHKTNSGIKIIQNNVLEIQITNNAENQIDYIIAEWMNKITNKKPVLESN